MQFRQRCGRSIVNCGSNQLGSGGEGTIYLIDGSKPLAAKIYNKPTSESENKLLAMLAAPPVDLTQSAEHISIAWPIDLLDSCDTTPAFKGFLMPLVSKSDFRPIHVFYGPADRQKFCPLFDYSYMHRTARNLAAATSALHKKGYVIGDVNGRNVLVSDQALVTIVDTDSLQVPDSNGHLYRCPVGTDEFTPPELQGKDFGTLDRKVEHDLFGLAVMIFQLLMEGTPPFAGEVKHGGNFPPSERIMKGYFPYGSRSEIVPPRQAPPFSLLYPKLQALFRDCFDSGHRDPSRRPTADTWKEHLEEAESRLIKCSANVRHRFGDHLGSCPWCERKKLWGRDPFPSAGLQIPLAPANAVAGKSSPGFLPPLPAKPIPAPTGPIPTLNSSPKKTHWYWIRIAAIAWFCFSVLSNVLRQCHTPLESESAQSGASPSASKIPETVAISVTPVPMATPNASATQQRPPEEVIVESNPTPELRRALPISTPTPAPVQPAVKAETYTITGKDVLVSTDRQSLARLMSLNGQKQNSGVFRQLRQLYKSLVQQELIFTPTPGTSVSVENYGTDGIDAVRIAGVDHDYYIADEDIKTKNASPGQETPPKSLNQVPAGLNQRRVYTVPELKRLLGQRLSGAWLRGDFILVKRSGNRAVLQSRAETARFGLEILQNGKPLVFAGRTFINVTLNQEINRLMNGNLITFTESDPLHLISVGKDAQGYTQAEAEF
jgi:serine/threonine protein kinase